MTFSSRSQHIVPTLFERLFVLLIILLIFIGCEPADTPQSEDSSTTTDQNVSGGDDQSVDPQTDLNPSEDLQVEMESDAEIETDQEPVEPELDLAPPILRDLTLNSIVPNRGSIEGGDEVQIVGTGFSPTTTFTFDRLICREIRVESTTRARCVIPEGVEVGLIDVSAYDERVEEGLIIPHQALLQEGFTYYIPLRVDQIIPDRGPSSGNTRVTLIGTGFIEGTLVSFGEQRSLQVDLDPNGRLSVLAPPAESGAVDLRLQNPNGDVTLPLAYYYYERLQVDELSPPIGPLTGGTPVQFRGQGFLPTTRVSFGERAADVLSGLGDEMNITTPRGAQEGPVDITIQNTNGDLTLLEGFIYYDESSTDLSVLGISPTRGPIQGGQTLYVAGNGFEEGADLLIDGRSAACEYLDAHRLRCTTPPNLAGLVDVSFEQDGESLDIDGGYAYFEDIEVISVFPDRGSISGGTLVELNGRGFTPDMEVYLGEEALIDLEVVDELFARGVTPPAPVSTVDVIAQTPYTTSVIESGYQYFDPTSGFGGVWGEDLDISMNVTVLNGTTFEPEPEVQLLLITQDQITLEGLTGPSGQATLSHPNLRGPGNITAAKEGFEVTTLEGVGVENITILLIPQPQPAPGAPPPGVPPARLQGTVRGLDLLPKPNSERYVNIVVIETSHTNLSNRHELPPPGPNGLLYEDGPFDIISRLGELAVIASAGRIERIILNQYLAGEMGYWEMRAELDVAVMGMRRFVSARSGEITEGLFIELDHPLDYEIPVDFDNPPYDPLNGPSYYAILPRLNLGAEGFWELETIALNLDPYLTLSEIPRLDGWGDDVKYFLLNLAFNPNSVDNTPLTITLEDTNDVDSGVLITPFAPAAHFISPSLGGVLSEDRILSWRLTEGYEGPMRAPSATVVAISEPALGPPTPLWRYVVPTGVTEVQIPILSPNAGNTGLNGGFMYLDINPFISEGRFEYDDFTYLDINGQRWKSYGISSTTFTE